MPLRRWVFAGDRSGAAAPGNIAAPTAALPQRILTARGLGESERAAFLAGEEELCDPFLMRDMEKAVLLVERVMEAGQLIAVYGDYDCDGITATALLYRYLEERGAKVAYYIPDRVDEGYGLNREACRALYQSGVSLVITVDNGISAYEEITYLRELGIAVLLTDHHQPPERLPDADALLNPHCEENYPFSELSGVGVALKLVCALEGDMDCRETLARYGDLCCVGTVADVVPLTGENRTIVRQGLACLQQSENVGLCALLAAAGLADKTLDSSSISYGLAPRINAASRMGQCEKSVELMLCDDPLIAAQLAGEIEECNLARKACEADIMKDAQRQLESTPALTQGRLIVLCGKGWHHGVIGITAARLCERYGKPCLLLALVGDEARGSARSIEGFSMIQAIRACAPLLTKFGGHTLAAGCTLPADKVEEFRAALETFAEQHCQEMPERTLQIDARLFPQELDLAAARSLSVLEPFGAHNETPTLLLADAVLEEITAMGEGRHLRLRLKAGGHSHSAVYFNQTPRQFPFAPGACLDAALTLSVSKYQGQERLSLKICDLRPAGFLQDDYFAAQNALARFLKGETIDQEAAASLTPTRDELAVLYRNIRASSLPDDGDSLCLRLFAQGLSPGKVALGLLVLKDAGLVNAQDGTLRVLPAAQKVDLLQTAPMQRLKALGV